MCSLPFDLLNPQQDSQGKTSFNNPVQPQPEQQGYRIKGWGLYLKQQSSQFPHFAESAVSPTTYPTIATQVWQSNTRVSLSALVAVLPEQEWAIRGYLPSPSSISFYVERFSDLPVLASSLQSYHLSTPFFLYKGCLLNDDDNPFLSKSKLLQQFIVGRKFAGMEVDSELLDSALEYWLLLKQQVLKHNQIPADDTFIRFLREDLRESTQFPNLLKQVLSFCDQEVGKRLVLLVHLLPLTSQTGHRVDLLAACDKAIGRESHPYTERHVPEQEQSKKLLRELINQNLQKKQANPAKAPAEQTFTRVFADDADFGLGFARSNSDSEVTGVQPKAPKGSALTQLFLNRKPLLRLRGFKQLLGSVYRFLKSLGLRSALRQLAPSSFTASLLYLTTSLHDSVTTLLDNLLNKFGSVIEPLASFPEQQLSFSTSQLSYSISVAGLTILVEQFLSATGKLALRIKSVTSQIPNKWEKKLAEKRAKKAKKKPKLMMIWDLEGPGSEYVIFSGKNHDGFEVPGEVFCRNLGVFNSMRIEIPKFNIYVDNHVTPRLDVDDENRESFKKMLTFLLNGSYKSPPMGIRPRSLGKLSNNESLYKLLLHLGLHKDAGDLIAVKVYITSYVGIENRAMRLYLIEIPFRSSVVYELVYIDVNHHVLGERGAKIRGNGFMNLEGCKTTMEEFLLGQESLADLYLELTDSIENGFKQE